MGPKGEILLREGTDFGMALLLCVYLPSVFCAELMCGWLGAKAGSRQQGEGGCGRGMVFGSSQDLGSMLGGYRFEDMFKLPLTPKPLTVFRIMSVFPMYRLSYLGCVMSLN